MAFFQQIIPPALLYSGWILLRRNLCIHMEPSRRKETKVYCKCWSCSGKDEGASETTENLLCK